MYLHTDVVGESCMKCKPAFGINEDEVKKNWFWNGMDVLCMWIECETKKNSLVNFTHLLAK